MLLDAGAKRALPAARDSAWRASHPVYAGTKRSTTHFARAKPWVLGLPAFVGGFFDADLTGMQSIPPVAESGA
jgi:hypothetical protein